MQSLATAYYIHGATHNDWGSSLCVMQNFSCPAIKLVELIFCMDKSAPGPEKDCAVRVNRHETIHMVTGTEQPHAMHDEAKLGTM